MDDSVLSMPIKTGADIPEAGMKFILLTNNGNNNISYNVAEFKHPCTKEQIARDWAKNYRDKCIGWVYIDDIAKNIVFEVLGVNVKFQW